MAPLTDRVGTFARLVSAIAITIAAAFFVVAFAALCVATIAGQGLGLDHIHLAGMLAISVVLAFFSSYLSWRLWRGSLSPNGLTIMPTWFIQMFGIFFLAGIVLAWWHAPNDSFLVEGAVLALGMVFFQRYVAKRRKDDAGRASADIDSGNNADRV